MMKPPLGDLCAKNAVKNAGGRNPETVKAAANLEHLKPKGNPNALDNAVCFLLLNFSSRFVKQCFFKYQIFSRNQ
jgi:hypothetical protein